MDGFMRSDKNPKLVCERNLERMLTGQRLLLARAAVLKSRVIAWRCQDSRSVVRGKHTHTEPLTPALQQTVESLQANKTGDMPTWQFFFEGMEGSFLYCKDGSISTGYIHNNTCTCKALKLDPRETPDDGLGAFRKLRSVYQLINRSNTSPMPRLT